ncbi:MAG: hypothetical protein IIB38_01910 [Candidatus Hydrogenedentes bacterium]|nr:hypothetical protein [Candidatus Hydrogenedentota bacterium]
MAQLDPKILAIRLAKALSRKRLWNSIYDDAMRLSMPNRNSFSRVSRGARKDDLVFDSTLSTSRTRFANRLQTELFPIFQKWADLVPGKFVVMDEEELEELKAVLRGIREVLFAAISVSNFDSVINEFLQDLGLGTGVFLILEGDDIIPLRFVSVPLSQVAFEEGMWGTIGAVFHQVTIPQGLLESMYEKLAFKNDDKPKDWDKIIADDREKEVEVTSITYSDFVRQADGSFEWRYDVFAKVDATDSKSLGVRFVSETFPDNPWIVSRWSKLAGEDFGRGPIIDALPDAKTLNKVVELVLKNAALAISPPLTGVDDGSWNMNIAVVRPNVIIPVSSNAGGARGPSLQPLLLQNNFNVADLIIEKLEIKIKKAMLDDQLPSEAGSVRSPTEIVERVRQLQQDIGAPFGRIHSEVLRPFIQRSINILLKKGVIQIEGVKRISVDGTGIEVRAISRLARVQNLAEIEAAAQWLELQRLLGDQAFDVNVNTENFGRWSADKLSVDPIIVRSVAEQQEMIDAIRQAEADAAARQQQQGLGTQQPEQALPIAS